MPYPYSSPDPISNPEGVLMEWAGITPSAHSESEQVAPKDISIFYKEEPASNVTNNPRNNIETALTLPFHAIDTVRSGFNKLYNSLFQRK